MAKTTLIGSLKVSLLAVTKGYTKGLGGAAKSTKRFTRLLRTNLKTALGLALGKLTAFGARGLGSIPRLVGRAVAGLAKLVKMLAVTLVAAAGAATVALVLLTKNSLKQLDRLAKSSRIIGTTVAELQAFELAAGEAGVEVKVVEKSLRNMTRQVNDAAKGTGEAVDALEDLGLSAKDLAKLSIPDQFSAIAKSLADVKDAGERIQLATDLFGGRGLSLLNLSAEALAAANVELDRMGLNISDIDAAKIEKFNDSVADLRRAFKGVGDQIAIRLAPIVGGVVIRITRMIEAFGGIDTIVGSVLASIKPKVLAFADGFSRAGLFIAQRISASMNVAAESIVGLGDKAVFVKNLIQRSFSVVSGVIKLGFLSVKLFVLGVITTIAFALDKMADGVIGTINTIRNAAVEAAKFVGIALDIKPIVRDPDNAITAIAEDMAATIDEVGKDIAALWSSTLDSALRINPQTPTGIDVLVKNTGDKLSHLATSGAASLAKLTEALNVAFIDTPTSERLTELLAKLRADFDGLANNIRDPIPDLEDLADGIEDTADAASKAKGIFEDLGDGIGSALKGAELSFESLRNIALDVARDIASAFAQQAITSAIGSIFSSAASSGGGSFGGGGASAPVASRSGDTFVIQLIGDNTGDDAIEQAVVRGINKARPELSKDAVSAVQKRIGRNPSFAFTGA